MPEIIRMPALAPNMTEGKVARWGKREGEPIQAGEVLAEIETDKATLELEAPASGVVARHLVRVGDAVPVDAPIALLLAPGEPAPNAGGASAAAAVEGRGLVARPPSPTAPPAAATPATPRGGRVFASPIARRLARERGLDLPALVGSGPGGRIVKDDVLSAPAPEIASAPAPAASAPPPAPAGATAVPHSSMRRAIARRLAEAKRTIPHYDLTVDVELDAVLDVRRGLNVRRGAGERLSLNDFVVKAVGLALREVPAVNASWTEDAMLRHASVDVAVAVATEAGLLTPIVRGADLKSVAAISAEVKELAARARAGRLRPDEYQGGGFGISNLGMHGIREFAAIINPPHSGILAVGAAEQRPVVRDGAVVVRTLMTCTLSADHRVVDGAVGARFLAAFRAALERPLELFA
jgi:pyruvate dehydrogenase E2 component (dihydrolipoamide acetyltransferase)